MKNDLVTDWPCRNWVWARQGVVCEGSIYEWHWWEGMPLPCHLMWNLKQQKLLRSYEFSPLTVVHHVQRYDTVTGGITHNSYVHDWNGGSSGIVLIHALSDMSERYWWRLSGASQWAGSPEWFCKGNKPGIGARVR